jgi:hypothetical protein
MSVTGIIPGSPCNTHSAEPATPHVCKNDLSVTPLHCLVDVCGVPEKYQFILLRLVTKARLDRLLGEREHGQFVAGRGYEKRRASRNNPVNEQSTIK